MFDRSKPELTEQAACEILHKTVIWNNKLSLFGLKAESVFYESLFKEGIISLRELAIKQGGLVIMGQILARTDLTECFCKISIIMCFLSHGGITLRLLIIMKRRTRRFQRERVKN